MGADVVVVMMLFMVFGIVLGYGAGQILGKRAQDDRQFWRANAGLLAAGVLVSAVSAYTGLLALVALSIGLIAGGVAGIKFGYGRSVGIWRRHDRLFRINADHLEADRAAREAQERGQTAREAQERDLVSVGPRAAGTPRGGAAAEKGRDEKGAGRRRELR